MVDPKIQQAIEAKRAQLEFARRALENAKKKVETLQAELRGAEELAKMLTTDAPAPAVDSAGQKRGLGDLWRSVIAEMALEFPKDFSLAEIAALCTKHGIKASPDTIRGQMHHHRHGTGFVEIPSTGRFRATEKGAAAAGVRLGEEIPF